MEPEQRDFIPWTQLDQLTSKRNWLGYAVVAVLVAGVMWVATNRFGSPKLIEVAVEPPPTVPTEPTAVPSVPELPVQEPTTVPQPQILSEADLAAVLPLGEAEPGPLSGGGYDLAPLAAAEWFVRDYFTIAGDRVPPSLASVGEPLPHGAGDGARTYVGWVQALSADVTGDSAEVVVALGLQRLAGDTWLEEPMGPVRVSLRLTEEGWAPSELPAPAGLELPSLKPDVVADAGDEVPDAVLNAAEGIIAGLGPEAQLASIGASAGRFRVVVMVGSPVRWPLVVWFDASGARVSPSDR